MIRIQQLKLPSEHDHKMLEDSVRKVLRCQKEDLITYHIIRRSVDSRKKPDIYFVYTIDAKVRNETVLLKRNHHKSITKATTGSYQPPEHGNLPITNRPVIVGCGPAGLFCALLLAREGFQPMILEQGECIEKRLQSVEQFWQTGSLNKLSNVQFGEGGAGTFSDGKLNTAVKDISGRNHYVLKTFVEFGAPEEILYLNKPHIGTDLLRTVVRNMREELIRLGAQVRFQSQLTDIVLKDGRVTEIIVNDKERIPCDNLILAIGHSARDTFSMLNKKPIMMTQKPFAVGVRIEHPQMMIDAAQYGRVRTKELSPADYKLTRRVDGRGVYSFCMCPGGYVVNASSEAGFTAVNGMSYHQRDGRNANCAMVVTVGEKDFGSDDVLAGLWFQRELEKSAYQVGNGKVPVQLLSDFRQGIKSSELGDVVPAIKGEYVFADLHLCFPQVILNALRMGIDACGQTIKGFDRADAVLSGVESRTSSPIRIYRDEELQSNMKGVYPCGEGAGYAGGITSAAIDGLKVAEVIIGRFSEKGIR